MDFRLAPDVNTVLMSFFLNYFRSSGPRISSHGNSMMFLVLIVLLWSLLFGLLMFRKYSVVILSVFLLCPFSVKMSIKTYISMYIYMYICYWCFPKDFEIIRSLQVLETVTWRKLGCFFSFSNSIVYCIDESSLLRMSKNCNDCSLLLTLAWLSSTNLLKVFGA